MTATRAPETCQGVRVPPEPFRALVRDRKLYQVRRCNGDLVVGETVAVRKWDPQEERLVGPEVLAEVVYISEPGLYGLPEGVRVVGFVSRSR